LILNYPTLNLSREKWSKVTVPARFPMAARPIPPPETITKAKEGMFRHVETPLQLN
jgi:hypothetical protein